MLDAMMIRSTTPVEMPASIAACRSLAEVQVAIEQPGDHEGVQRRHHAHFRRRRDAEAQEHDDQHGHGQRRAGLRQLRAEGLPLKGESSRGKPRRRPCT
jgi:hypothetical protein